MILTVVRLHQINNLEFLICAVLVAVKHNSSPAGLIVVAANGAIGVFLFVVQLFRCQLTVVPIEPIAEVVTQTALKV